jgi:ribonuclease P protein component
MVLAAEQQEGEETRLGDTRSQSFSRTDKLIKPTDFKRVFDKPFVSSDPYFKVLARPNDGSSSRLGLAVSRKVDRRATGRNRIKRVARESFRRELNRPGQLALDHVVLPRPHCDSISNRQLFESLQGHWRRLQQKAIQKQANKGTK